MAPFLKKLILFVFVTLGAFTLALEVWSPFGKPVKSAYINTTITYHNESVKQLPEYIQVRYNNQGFIGENYSDTITRKRIYFVGWSNTQSLFVSEGSKWTDVSLKDAGVWYNNAAADGTLIPTWCKIIKGFANTKPDVVIALIDPFVGMKERDKKPDGALLSLLKKSNLFSQLILPYWHSKKEIRIGHRSVDWSSLPEDTTQQPYGGLSEVDLVFVQSQLDSLRTTIVQAGALPVFISAPTPFGDFIEGDLNMGKKQNSRFTDAQYKEFDRILSDYCTAKGCGFISGYSLPKSTVNFYDYSHFTREGSKAFGLQLRPSFFEIIQNIDQER
ncbi:MAG: hypothetical protein ACU4F9_06725 [Arcticibacter sp.]